MGALLVFSRRSGLGGGPAQLIFLVVHDTLGAAVFSQQPFVVAIQLRDLFLAHGEALLCLSQFHLQLLNLAFMALLLLLALLPDRVAVVLQCFAGVLVFFLKRVNLTLLVLQARFQIKIGLQQPGMLGLGALQRLPGLEQGGGLMFDGLVALLQVFLQLTDLSPGCRQLLLQVIAAGLVLIVRLIYALLRLFVKALGEVSHQIAQFFIDVRRWRVRVIQLLEVAMNRGFRTGITHLDAYRINTRVLASGQQRSPCLEHQCLVYAAPSHAFSYDFVLWYVPCNYILYYLK
ncbi:FOG: Zn-finger [Pseudomonas syringae pv. actinidiae]|uniref:FOG: Zn-finger n=1 Tax=Pseudomonas syringae pv. actinidiae TaxID=103796 RepID=A0A2V0QJQ7_PSESF|nr:FOG: Zn-finger [Pseudomonas syringae pv. actinidiae]